MAIDVLLQRLFLVPIRAQRKLRQYIPTLLLLRWVSSYRESQPVWVAHGSGARRMGGPIKADVGGSPRSTARAYWYDAIGGPEWQSRLARVGP